MPLQLKIMLLTISVVFLTLLTAGILVIKNVALSHPITANVGTPMADLYREPVLHGQEYVYVGKGSLAPSLRANVPIYAPDDPARQIGFVSVGFYLDDLNKTIAAGTKQVLYALLIALAFSVGGAVYVARDVKKAIFGLEPHEIAALLRERTATLEAIREGVVAVDKQGCIRMLNSEAAKLGHDPKDIPKNFHVNTFNAIIDYLSRQTVPRSAEEVAQGTGVSRVTARRYLEYLVTQGQLQMVLEYLSVGRPLHRFKLKTRDGL